MPDTRIHVPYITSWSTETPVIPTVIRHPNGVGIAYADETMGDRDRSGILWVRVPSTPGTGRPLFGKVHSLRQRRAMRRLLCQVCGEPADQAPDGVLWLLLDHRADWPGWPNRMGVTEPPICRPCAELSVHACPALRDGYALVRAQVYDIAGVQGMRYRPGNTGVAAVDLAMVAHSDAAAPWVLASNLVRELRDCVIVD
ncbi:hypothetical protein [Actinokineospora inagensis]|uniref:hypothetical protein n=1 Tax=Actinokineospora inagensis TaxID=103730 RepID=UPI0003F67416|nr:hypothetical protein [Actinokineospora inagensis]